MKKRRGRLLSRFSLIFIRIDIMGKGTVNFD